MQIRANPPAALSLRAECGAGEEVACADGAPLVVDALPAGTWYISAQGRFGPTRLTLDVAVSPPPGCGNEVDDDGDGRVDLADPGCEGPDDPDEADPPLPPLCANRRDDDGDGAVDWPDDPQCVAAGTPREASACGGRAAAAELSGEGEWHLDLPMGEGASAYAGSCGGAGAEAVVVVNLPVPARLSARIAGQRNAFVYLRSACDGPGDELLCARYFEGGAFDADLPSGTWFLFFDDAAPAAPVGRIGVDIQVAAIPPPVCGNGADDDLDGRVDAADLGCVDAVDGDEADPPAAAPPPRCANGLDDDADGLTDWPADPQCAAAGDPSEAPRCEGLGVSVVEVPTEGGVFPVPHRVAPSLVRGGCGAGEAPETVFALELSELSDVQLALRGEGGDLRGRLFARRVCDDPATERRCVEGADMALPELAPGTWFFFAEISPVLEDAPRPRLEITVRPQTRACSDGLDNDGDGLVDAADPGCTHPYDLDEADTGARADCSNGLDDDGDGAVDWPADLDCAGAGQPAEVPWCGLNLPAVEVSAPGARLELPRVARPAGGLIGGGCGLQGDARETLMALELGERSNLTLRATPSAPQPLSLYLRSDCADRATELGCDDRQRLVVRDLAPGWWFAVVDPFAPVALDLEVEIEGLSRACSDGLDNDGDGATDEVDTGCTDPLDDDEAGAPTPPACANGVDDDGDGRADYPDDPQCRAAGDPAEVRRCAQGGPVVEWVDEGGVLPVNTAAGGHHYGLSCADGAQDGGSGGEVLVALTLSRPSTVRLETRAATYDTAIEVRADCDDPASVVACDDDGGQDGWSLIEGLALEPGTWIIQVDGFSDKEGQADLHLEVTPRAP